MTWITPGRERHEVCSRDAEQIACCGQCEGLMLAAVDASRVYHALMAELEEAHIRHDPEQPFHIQERVAKALTDRDEAIRVLNDHERAHKRARPLQIAAGS
jgi:hypothetical protein